MTFLRLFAVLALCPLAGQAASQEERALRPYEAPAVVEAKAWPRERLLAFARELADFVEKNHVVTDPARKTYGMVYEFWKDGKAMQEFGLDAMHDGAWLMSALVTMQRADPKGNWLARAQKFEVPFYTNLLNRSDALFPAMQPTEEDKHPWKAPVKGWAPRGWDDGGGIDRKTGQPFADSYFTGSNHLAQDLADSLMNVWLSTRDPAVTEALGHLRDYKRQCFGPIQGLEIAADVSAGQADAFIKYRFPPFTPAAAAPYFSGLFEKKAQRLANYDDGLAWTYRQCTAAAQISGELPRGATLTALARAHGDAALMELWSDDRPFRFGEWFFDLQRAPAFKEGAGKLEEYASSSKNFYGSRGIEIAWIAAGVLPELKAQPALWESHRREKHAGEPVVRIVDEPPMTDGAKDAVYAKSQAIGDDSARVTLVGDPRNLHIFIETTRPQLVVTIQEAASEKTGKVALESASTFPANLCAKAKAKPTPKTKTTEKSKDKKGGAKTAQTSAKATPAPVAAPEPAFTHGGKLTVTHDRTFSAVNEKGERLLTAAEFTGGEFKQGEGTAWTAEVRIPYSVVPGQRTWINGADFGRYKIGIDAAAPVTIYMLSEPARVQRRLEQTVLGTIDFWHEVWKQAGVIPSGWRSETVPAGAWEISDAGGYAHLLHAIALWLIYENGNREWQLIRDQFPTAPRPAPPLPASVLKAQGVE